MDGRRSSDVGAGEEEDAIAITALAQIQSAGTFVIGSLEGSNEEA